MRSAPCTEVSLQAGAEERVWTRSALASERQAMQQLQSRKAWGVTCAELERQLQQQRRSAEADKAASLQSLKDLLQRCYSASPANSTCLGLLPFDMLACRSQDPAVRSAPCSRRMSACMRVVPLFWRLVMQCQASARLPRQAASLCLAGAPQEPQTPVVHVREELA